MKMSGSEGHEVVAVVIVANVRWQDGGTPTALNDSEEDGR
jgi:hypothetical protein